MGFPLLSFFFRKSNNRSSSEAQSTGSNSPLVSIRLAVYDNFTSEPRIIDMENGDAGDLIARGSERVHAECKKNGGRIPFAVIRGCRKPNSCGLQRFGHIDLTGRM